MAIEYRTHKVTIEGICGDITTRADLDIAKAIAMAAKDSRPFLECDLYKLLARSVMWIDSADNWTDRGDAVDNFIAAAQALAGKVSAT